MTNLHFIDTNGRPCLYQSFVPAIRVGHMPIQRIGVRAVVTGGCEVDTRDEGDMTSLHHASENSQIAVVTYLVSVESSLNAVDSDGQATDTSSGCEWSFGCGASDDPTKKQSTRNTYGGVKSSPSESIGAERKNVLLSHTTGGVWMLWRRRSIVTLQKNAPDRGLERSAPSPVPAAALRASARALLWVGSAVPNGPSDG